MKCLGPHIPMCAVSEAQGRSTSVQELPGRDSGGRNGPRPTSPLSKRGMVNPQLIINLYFAKWPQTRARISCSGAPTAADRWWGG